MTDDELLAHIRESSDPAAFGELARRHELRIVKLLRRLTGGDHALADDLAQETFLLAFRHIARFRGDASIATWLVRIAVRQYLSEARRRRPELVETVDEGHASETDPAVRIDLDRGLDRIRAEQRLALVLTHEHGMTHAEVAELTGWPLGTVKTHAKRGREALRAELGGTDDDG